MNWWQNIPFALILIPMLCSSITLILRPKAARMVMLAVPFAGILASALLLVETRRLGMAFTYALGGFGAPYGNELRCGTLEALLATVFCTVLFLSLLGGYNRLCVHIAGHRQNLYCVMVLLLMAALMALTFTNDMFTGYVFIEIMTIAAGGLIAARSTGRTLFGATKYMIMNIMGSGLFLMGLSIMYCYTGHLLMSNIHEQLVLLAQNDAYHMPIILSMALITVGIAVKSALFPFYAWLRDAYGTATPASSAILSSLVSKAYIFLYIKIVLRVLGMDMMEALGIQKLLLIYAMIGIIMGSVYAIAEKKLRGMVAYSSVAQIGYIYLGIAINTQAGMAAAVFHILAHSFAKSLLFLSGDRLIGASDGDDHYPALMGAGMRSVVNGILFTVGACSIVGIPVLGGFTSKLFLAEACLTLAPSARLAAMLVLAISTGLNATYFMVTVITIYRKTDREYTTKLQHSFASTAALVVLGVLIVLLGLGASRVFAMITLGIQQMA